MVICLVIGVDSGDIMAMVVTRAGSSSPPSKESASTNPKGK